MDNHVRFSGTKYEKGNNTNRGNHYKCGKSNLKLIINELKHDIFKHINNDLFITIDLKLYQALFGFHKIIKHLDGRDLYINNSKLTNFNMIKKIPNEGMKRLNNVNGDLYIKFNILLPQLDLIDNNEYKEHLKRLLQILNQDDVKLESNIINSNLSNTNLLECNEDITNIIHKLINENNNNENTRPTGNNHKNRSQSECVHQ